MSLESIQSFGQYRGHTTINHPHPQTGGCHHKTITEEQTKVIGDYSLTCFGRSLRYDRRNWMEGGGGGVD